MTKVIDAGETKVINSSDAIGLWEQLPAAAGPPVSDAIIARWHRLTGLEYDPDLAIIERRNAELAYIARLTDNDANWCRLGIVQCRLDSYDAAIKTLARVKGRLIPKARCWAAIAYARGGNVEAAKKIVNELKHSDQAIDSRELALAEGAIAEESEDVEKALAHYREAQDMLWVKDWIVEASLKKHDYQAAYQAYAQLKLEQLTPERWRKFAWLCLAVKDFSSFVRACDFLEEHAKQTLDFQASYKALMVLALDVDKPKRHAWELNAWEQVAPEVDRHPAESAFRMLTLARETFIDLAKEDKLRELSLDENGDIDYRPLYAASLLDIAAMNPRHAPANTTLGELSSSFQKELLATKDFPADVVSRLNWEDQVLYHYLIESADETFASSTSQRANKLLENDQLQDAEKLCRDFYDAPEWSDVRHIAWKQEIGGVLALLLANGQDRQATSKVLQELEDSLSDQNYTPLFNMALAHCLVGGGPAYIAFCERLLKKYGNTDDPILANALGTVCALNPLPPTIDADLRRLNAVPQPGQSDFDNNRMQALLHIQTEEFELAREDLKLAEKHRLASDFKPFPIREAIVELSINPSSQEGIDRLTESIQLLEKHDQSKDQDGNRESWITRILYRRLIEWAQSLREK